MNFPSPWITILTFVAIFRELARNLQHQQLLSCEVRNNLRLGPTSDDGPVGRGPWSVDADGRASRRAPCARREILRE